MKKLIFIAMLLASACLHVNAADGNVPVGHYGKFEYNAASGDLLGIELQFVRGRSGYFVLFQVAQGEREDPVLVPIKVSGPTIEIVLPEGKTSYTGVLKATLRGNTLEMQFANGQLSPSGERVFKLKKR